MNDETDFSRPEKRPKNTTNNPHQGAVLCGPENWREYRKEGEKGEREEIRKQASGKRQLTQNREEERQRRANTQPKCIPATCMKMLSDLSLSLLPSLGFPVPGG